MLHMTDPESGQQLKASTIGEPGSAILIDSTFTRSVPADFTGIQTIKFIVIDNGAPAMSDPAVPTGNCSIHVVRSKRSSLP
jgi:hypothetical protein